MGDELLVIIERMVQGLSWMSLDKIVSSCFFSSLEYGRLVTCRSGSGEQSPDPTSSLEQGGGKGVQMYIDLIIR